MKYCILIAVLLACCLLFGCAGQRQGVVCDEIEYRLNNMAYSPDQRYYMEEELKACREDEAKKKTASAEKRQSIYDRFKASDTTKVHTAADTSAAGTEPADISVSEALKDSSGTPTTSIYDRYGGTGTAHSLAQNPAEETAPDTSASDVSNFQ